MKKLRITMVSSLSDRAVTVSIWIDNVKVENSISILETWTNDYDLSSTNPHTLRIKMENDYIDNQEDLNLIINKIQLSNDDGVFPQYDYLIPMENMNPRSEDNTKLQTAIMWGTPNEFNMSIDEVNPIVWHDYHLETLENPPQ
jgi:hypothetical protein